MIDTLLALVPTYGVWLIMISVCLSCLALPIPSSMLVMAAGGFAAAGDFAYWQLVAFAFVGFAVGDQIAFAIARSGGPRLLERFKRHAKTASVLNSAEALVARRGSTAVVLSRTVVSPVGPYVSYISGALRLSWVKFTSAAILGAMLWCLGYSWLGYAFASHIPEVASMIGNFAGIILAGAAGGGLVWWMVRSYRRHQAEGRDDT
ncbi:VTT domain-containing protein [Alphaproteobacteria bacterium KMM 3653]|uniref:VTT domain-containing protein n=1 Tax=Harenicola maris TaxID=2841044 RepID=A0AAP2G903_9RHOB|nr:VTT domain-containing protein [Harenicola maris]